MNDELIRIIQALYINKAITLKELTKGLNLITNESNIKNAYIDTLKLKGLKEGKKQ
jgi:hypothetical protein